MIIKGVQHINVLIHIMTTSHSDLDMSASDRQACIDDTNTEIGFYLTLLYMLLEVHRGDESFGTELGKFLSVSAGITRVERWEMVE